MVRELVDFAGRHGMSRIVSENLSPHRIRLMCQGSIVLSPDARECLLKLLPQVPDTIFSCTEDSDSMPAAQRSAAETIHQDDMSHEKDVDIIHNCSRLARWLAGTVHQSRAGTAITTLHANLWPINMSLVNKESTRFIQHEKPTNHQLLQVCLCLQRTLGWGFLPEGSLALIAKFSVGNPSNVWFNFSWDKTCTIEGKPWVDDGEYFGVKTATQPTKDATQPTKEKRIYKYTVTPQDEKRQKHWVTQQLMNAQESTVDDATTEEEDEEEHDEHSHVTQSSPREPEMMDYCELKVCAAPRVQDTIPDACMMHMRMPRRNAPRPQDTPPSDAYTQHIYRSRMTTMRRVSGTGRHEGVTSMVSRSSVMQIKRTEIFMAWRARTNRSLD